MKSFWKFASSALARTLSGRIALRASVETSLTKIFPQGVIDFEKGC